MIIVLRGLPGAGKTTLAKRLVHDHNFVRVSRDAIRKEVFGLVIKGSLTTEQEAEITAMIDEQVTRFVRLGQDVVVDEQNIRQRRARHWFKFGTEVVFVNLNVDADVLRKRNSKRSSKVAPSYLESQIQKFAGKNFPPEPEPWERATQPYHLTDAIIVDIDGTIAHKNPNRTYYEYHNVIDDTPNYDVLSIVETVAQFLIERVIFVSGRPEMCRTQTESWLDDLGFENYWLYMRENGDQRSDDLVKYEMFNKHIRDKYHVRAVFDDRLRVCRMWHALGLPLFRVGDPDADY